MCECASVLACNQLACEHEPLVYDQLELVWHVYVYTYIRTYLCTCGHLCLFECTYYDNWTCCVCVCGYVCEISVCVFCFLLSLLSSPTTPILPFSLSSHSPSSSLSPPLLPPSPPLPHTPPVDTAHPGHSAHRAQLTSQALQDPLPQHAVWGQHHPGQQWLGVGQPAGVGRPATGALRQLQYGHRG